MYVLILFCAFCTLFNEINCSVARQSLDSKFIDLYSKCSQFDGTKLCIGTLEKETSELPNLDCVNSRNCIMLFQFEMVTDNDDSSRNDLAEHCLYLDRRFLDGIMQQIQKDDLTPLLGVRFGYVPISPMLESSCFLGNSVDFLQIIYPDLTRNRLKKRPSFDNTEIRYDNSPNSDLIYCCFKQSINLKVMNATKFDTLDELYEVDLNKPIYPSLYYRIEKFDNTYKSFTPYNLTQYRDRSQFTTTTVQSTTKMLSSPPESSSTTTASSILSTTDSDENQTNEILSAEATTVTVNQTNQVEIEAVKSSDKGVEATNSAGAGKILIIFTLAIVLMTFFVLIALSIYNLIIK